MSNKPHDVATTATAEFGEVMLDGPDGLAISLTPDAASKSAQSIHAAADMARQQRENGETAAPRDYEGGGTGTA